MTLATFDIPGQEWQRVRRFFVVGVSSTALDWVLLVVLKHIGLSTPPADSLAFSLATLYNFAVSCAWTYAGTKRKAISVQFSLFVITNLLGLLLNDALVLLLEAPFDTLFGGVCARVRACQSDRDRRSGRVELPRQSTPGVYRRALAASFARKITLKERKCINSRPG